jgi:hypothetical protein
MQTNDLLSGPIGVTQNSAAEHSETIPAILSLQDDDKTVSTMEARSFFNLLNSASASSLEAFMFISIARRFGLREARRVSSKLSWDTGPVLQFLNNSASVQRPPAIPAAIAGVALKALKRQCRR